MFADTIPDWIGLICTILSCLELMAFFVLFFVVFGIRKWSTERTLYLAALLALILFIFVSIPSEVCLIRHPDPIITPDGTFFQHFFCPQDTYPAFEGEEGIILDRCPQFPFVASKEHPWPAYFGYSFSINLFISILVLLRAWSLHTLSPIPNNTAFALFALIAGVCLLGDGLLNVLLLGKSMSSDPAIEVGVNCTGLNSYKVMQIITALVPPFALLLVEGLMLCSYRNALETRDEPILTDTIPLVQRKGAGMTSDAVYARGQYERILPGIFAVVSTLFRAMTSFKPYVALEMQSVGAALIYNISALATFVFFPLVVFLHRMPSPPNSVRNALMDPTSRLHFHRFLSDVDALSPIMLLRGTAGYRTSAAQGEGAAEAEALGQMISQDIGVSMDSRLASPVLSTVERALDTSAFPLDLFEPLEKSALEDLSEQFKLFQLSRQWQLLIRDLEHQAVHAPGQSVIGLMTVKLKEKQMMTGVQADGAWAHPLIE